MDAGFQSSKGWSSGRTGTATPRPVESPDMKCLVLAVHGLRLDCLGCYGNDWIETPNLDRFAAESVVFDQHLADRPDQDGSWRTWCAGRTDLFQPLSAAGVDTRLVGDGGGRPPGDFI